MLIHSRRLTVAILNSWTPLGLGYGILLVSAGGAIQTRAAVSALISTVSLFTCQISVATMQTDYDKQARALSMSTSSYPFPALRFSLTDPHGVAVCAYSFVPFLLMLRCSALKTRCFAAQISNEAVTNASHRPVQIPSVRCVNVPKAYHYLVSRTDFGPFDMWMSNSRLRALGFPNESGTWLAESWGPPQELAQWLLYPLPQVFLQRAIELKYADSSAGECEKPWRRRCLS